MTTSRNAHKCYACPKTIEAGVSFNKAITSTVAAKVKSAVITSSPCSKPNPIMAICKASVPFAHGITCFTPK